MDVSSIITNVVCIRRMDDIRFTRYTKMKTPVFDRITYGISTSGGMLFMYEAFSQLSESWKMVIFMVVGFYIGFRSK